MNIGEQINNLRKQHGLSQDDFANLFNDFVIKNVLMDQNFF